MKVVVQALAVAALCGMLAARGEPAPADPQVGQSAAAAIAALGQPMGRVGGPAQTVLMFPRGNVVVKDGRITSVHLISAEALAARQADAAAAAEQRAADQARAEALRRQFLADPAYLALPTRDRLLALERFEREHPGSGIRQDYHALLAVYQTEQAALTRVAALEAPVQAMEKETATAKENATAPAAPAAPAAPPAPPATTYGYATGTYVAGGSYFPNGPSQRGPIVSVNGGGIAITAGGTGWANGWCYGGGSTVIIVGGLRAGPGGAQRPIRIGRTRIYPSGNGF